MSPRTPIPEYLSLVDRKALECRSPSALVIGRHNTSGLSCHLWANVCRTDSHVIFV